MKFRITRTSDFYGENKPWKGLTKGIGGWYKELNTIDELMGFIKEVGCDVIVSVHKEPSIEIYDDYRE